MHEQALADKYHENSIQGAYGGGNQGYEVERGWSMDHMEHGWVHNMEGYHQEVEFSFIAMNDTYGPHLQSAWASLVPKIAAYGLQNLNFESYSSLSSLGIKEHAWAHIEANQQGHKSGLQD